MEDWSQEERATWATILVLCAVAIGLLLGLLAYQH